MTQQPPSDCLIYKLDLSAYQPICVTVPEGSRSEIWRPSLKWPLRCTRFPYWYDLYWFFYFLGVFRNKNYCAITLKTEKRTDAALMVVPTWFRWRFMKKADVQIIYVVTHPLLLRRGLSLLNMQNALNHIMASKDVDTIWYVTTSDNLASQKLCSALGFEFAGFGVRNKEHGLFKTLDLLQVNDEYK